MTAVFNYNRAFSRNIGWVLETEQLLLRTKRVAIAGLGGVGGSHLLTLTRLGVGAFTLADFDHFDIANFNRQAGARLSSIGEPKLQTMIDMALDINPELEIRSFPGGVQATNADDFLTDVDLYIDGLDFFAVDARRAVFEACYRLGVPAVTAAPLGMGTAVLNFLPGKMSFEEYFRLEGCSKEEQYLRFFIGLAPARLHASYLLDPARINLPAQKGPSTAMGCELCAGAAATQALKILLRRGPVIAAPGGMHFDAYNNRLARTWRPGGNRNPLQRLAIYLGTKRMLNQPPPSPEATHQVPETNAEKVLDLARWAPSGDDTQPWRFVLHSPNAFRIQGRDTRKTVVYDLDGRASQLALGALLESVDIAASYLGLRAEIQRVIEAPEERPAFEVQLHPDPGVTPNPLAPFLPIRTVERRAMSTRPLTSREHQILEQALPKGYQLRWFESLTERWQAARLMFANAKVRLTMPEAYQVHREIIAWDRQFSHDRIPEQAVGVDRATGKIMRWTMGSWRRVAFMNRYLAGTLAPRLQLDLIPGLLCAGHFALIAPQEPDTLEDYLEAGRAVQRFWLTAARLGLNIQPEMTPLIFSRYIREKRHFTRVQQVQALANRNSARLEELLPGEASQALFMGRIGEGPLPRSRSLRKSLDELLVETQ